jgi:hypothetical protein
MQVNEILARLPAVQNWIDELVERSRPNARPVSELEFKRLGDFYSAETLQRAQCVVTNTIPLPPLTALGLPGFEDFENGSPLGITYGDLYFVRAWRFGDESLHFHELVHTIQWNHLGPEKFLEEYALGYLNAGVYENNPLEQIAFALQERFEDGEKTFQVEPLVLRHLREIVGGASK